MECFHMRRSMGVNWKNMLTKAVTIEKLRLCSTSIDFWTWVQRSELLQHSLCWEGMELDTLMGDLWDVYEG